MADLHYEYMSVNQHRVERHLANGWEPFAVTNDSSGDLRIHLRRKTNTLSDWGKT